MSKEGNGKVKVACWLPVIVLLLAFALRVYKLGDQNVWWDEAFSVWVTRHDLGTLTTIAAGDTHPPLYYWLLNPWMALTGPGEFAIRFPSLVYGVGTVALVYRLMTAERGRQTAVGIGALAALLLATSRFHVWWSQEIRMYSLATMWAVASSLALLMALRTRTTRWWIAYVLTAIAGMYSLYLFAFVLAAQNVFILWWWLWRLRCKLPVTRHQVGGWIGIMVTVVLAMLPWMAYTLPRLKSWSAASQFSPLTYLQLYATVLTLGITTFVERYWWANLLVLGVIAAGLVAGRKSQYPTPVLRAGASVSNAHYEPCILHLASCLLLVPALGVFLLLTLPQGLFYRPPLEARYQLLSVPALALILAGSIAALWQWRKIAGVMAGVAIFALSLWVLPGYYDGRHLRDDFQTMTRAVAAYAEPGDALLLVSGDRFPLFQFRYDALLNRSQLPDVTTISVVKVTPQDVERVLVPLAASHRRVWLAEVEKNLQDPDSLLAGWLDKNRNAVWREGYGYNRLSLYNVDLEPPVSANTFGEHKLWAEVGGALFWGYDLPVREVWPGEVVRMVSYFQVGNPFTLTVSLADAAGRVLESRDYWIVRSKNGTARVRFDVPIFSRAPPGEYQFRFAPLHSASLDVPVRIVGTPPLEQVKAIPNSGDFQVGQTIRLVGFDAAGQVRPGSSMPVKLYWRTPAKLQERYTAFVQLVGTQHNPKTNGRLWAGHDSEPLDGGYPTTQWFVNTIIADTHVLIISPDTPPGEYELWAGMYTQPDIKRLPVYDAQGNLVGDHVVLSKVTVK